MTGCAQLATDQVLTTRLPISAKILHVHHPSMMPYRMAVLLTNQLQPFTACTAEKASATMALVANSARTIASIRPVLFRTYPHLGPLKGWW